MTIPIWVFCGLDCPGRLGHGCEVLLKYQCPIILVLMKGFIDPFPSPQI